MRNRKDILSFGNVSEAFDSSSLKMVRNLLEKKREALIPQENIFKYQHGETWLEISPDAASEEASFATHSHEASIPFGRIIDNDLTVIGDYVNDIVESMNEEFSKFMYAKMGEVTSRFGNTVDAKNYASQGEAFLQMLEKIEFGVDREGKVSKPEIHMHPDAFEKFQTGIKAEGDEFEAQVRKLTERKEKEALEREASRVAKFKSVES